MKPGHGPPPGPKAPFWASGGKHDREPGTCEGRIEEWKWNHEGKPDGFRLEDGTDVRFPPHEAAGVLKVTNGPRVGIEVFVEGFWHGREPRHFDAERLSIVGGNGGRGAPPDGLPARHDGGDDDEPSEEGMRAFMEAMSERMERLEGAVAALHHGEAGGSAS